MPAMRWFCSDGQAAIDKFDKNEFSICLLGRHDAQ